MRFFTYTQSITETIFFKNTMTSEDSLEDILKDLKASIEKQNKI